jgi:hypothetical protein
MQPGTITCVSSKDCLRCPKFVNSAGRALAVDFIEDASREDFAQTERIASAAWRARGPAHYSEPLQPSQLVVGIMMLCFVVLVVGLMVGFYIGQNS